MCIQELPAQIPQVWGAGAEMGLWCALGQMDVIIIGPAGQAVGLTKKKVSEM